jgi:hypothetical protein
MLSPAKRILAITATGCDCYLAAGRRLVLEARFVSGEGKDFAEFARSRKHSIFYALADQIEEDFRQDSLPFLRGPARAQLLARKASQIYRDSPFHTTASLGRAADGRRDERVQLLGLTNAEGLNEWLTPLSAAGIRVAGLYSPPVAAPDLLRLLKSQIGARPKRLLVVSVNRAGLRQTLVDGQVARFSRLAAVAHDEGDDFAANCLAEVNKTQQYLVGLRLLPREESLPALILVPPGEVPRWSRPGLLVDAVEAIFVDIASARRAAGLARVDASGDAGDLTEGDARFADSLWVHTIAQRRPRLDFSPPWLREAFRLWQARVALWASGAAIMAAGVGLGIERLAQAEILLGDAARLGTEARRNELNYERTKRGFPPLPAPPEQLKASVTSFEKLSARAIAPAALLAEIGQILGRAPEFRLLRLEWQQGEVEPIEGVADPAQAGMGAKAPERFEWVTLRGMIGNPVSPADARRETEIALRTADLLRTVRGSRVVITRSPVDLTPRGRLAGDSAAEAANPRSGIESGGNVEIRVARKAGT